MDSELNKAQRSLKDIDRLLKLDPTNTELLAQKQKLLSDSIKETETRLDVLKQADKQAKTQLESGKLGQDKYDALQREIIQTEQKLKGLKETASDMANGVEASAEKASSGMENIGKKIDMGNLMEASDVISGIGEKIIDFGEKTVGAFSDLESATTRVNTYFGLTGKAAEEMGGVVERVFKTGVTDSLEEVAEAVIAVKNNLKDLSPKELENITNQAINLDKVFGSDINESMRGVNALMTHFGIDAQTAMDYLVKGTQNGLDKTQELGDNLSEYAGKFSQAGYSAAEYFQLLQNGLEGGAYNLDKVNDSINEVTTRLADGTIADSIGMFSQETQDLFAKWQEGGATQKEVINSIVSDIDNATSQQEALTMAATAFGTMGEDANLGVVESLTTLGDSYADVGGTAAQMSEDATTPMQELQASVNDLQTELAPLGEELIGIATEVLPPIIEGITSLIEGFLSLPGPVQAFIGIFAGVIALFAVLAPIISAVTTIIGFFGTGVLAPLIGIIAAVAAAITAIIAIITNWGAIVEWVGETCSNICQAVSEFFSGMASSVTSAVSSLASQLSSKWSSIKQTALETWESIKRKVSEIVENIKQKAVETFESMKESVGNTVGNIAEAVEEGFQAAIDFITGLPGKALQWGADFINGLADGIRGAISAVTGAVSDVVSTITSFLHFSRPEKGPLHYYEQWMPDMVEGLASGIIKNIPTITRATNQLANAMTVQPVADAGIDYSRMAGVFAKAAGGIKQTVYIDERSFKRGLIDMGVEFSG